MTDKLTKKNRKSSSRANSRRSAILNKSRSVTVILARKKQSYRSSKPEVLRHYDRYHYNSEENLGISTRSPCRASSEENDNRKCDMVAKTGNSYITGTKTDSVEIPTSTSLESSTIANQNKVLPSDCDSDRQPEIVMWPQNRKYLYLWKCDR